MGLRIVHERPAVPVDYLANIVPADFERERAGGLPEEISGDEFLARYGGTGDTVTTVERGRRYRVRVKGLRGRN